MTEAVGKEIAIEGVDPRELYGPRNVYLDQIKALHPQLRIVARGSSLKVLGSEAETQRFGRHMEGLVAYTSNTGISRPKSSARLSPVISPDRKPRLTRTSSFTATTAISFARVRSTSKSW